MAPNSSLMTAGLVSGMLISGAANSLVSKYQDMQCVADCDSARPKVFEQPVWQTATMFLGEMLCLVALQLLVSRLNPFRRKSTSQPDSKGLYARVGTSDPTDSGIAIDDVQYAPEGVQAAITSTRIGEAETVEARHGPTANPVALAVDAEAAQVAEDPKMTGYQQALFALPAFFDICGTTLMNVGLLFTPVSVYQMTRSALVLFVGLFSVLYLNRRLSRSQIAALGLVTLGVFIVGMSNMFKPAADDSETAADPSRVLLGIGIILFAQVFTASQFVIEEKIMNRYSVEPLRAVGLEGVFGLSVTLLLMGICFIFIGRTPAGRGGYFDAPDGWRQIIDNPTVWYSSIAICISIALFNFFGLAVTKTVSATARSTIDCCRTLGIWACSLYLGWEEFQTLQVVGFAVLVYGTFVFNGIMDFPSFLGGDTSSEETPRRRPTSRARESLKDNARSLSRASSYQDRSLPSRSRSSSKHRRTNSGNERTPLLDDK